MGTLKQYISRSAALGTACKANQVKVSSHLPSPAAQPNHPHHHVPGSSIRQWNSPSFRNLPPPPPQPSPLPTACSPVVRASTYYAVLGGQNGTCATPPYIFERDIEKELPELMDSVPKMPATMPSGGRAQVTPQPPQFYLGPAGSGAPVHFHGDAWNALMYGRKHWILFPPTDAKFSKVPVSEWVADNPDVLYVRPHPHTGARVRTPCRRGPWKQGSCVRSTCPADSAWWLGYFQGQRASCDSRGRRRPLRATGLEPRRAEPTIFDRGRTGVRFDLR